MPNKDVLQRPLAVCSSYIAMRVHGASSNKDRCLWLNVLERCLPKIYGQLIENTSSRFVNSYLSFMSLDHRKLDQEPKTRVDVF